MLQESNPNSVVEWKYSDLNGAKFLLFMLLYSEVASLLIMKRSLIINH